ncbi:manganese efflux pump MntP family protein [Miniphocaeibacter massiliensis]|uniref:manganese efflux pump MntP n=1 Tax=Miniphocaeibacter massiliensis TaxID=2041841 RepID=UPI000C1B8356|nr:manganese efflux pump MntP family protein [Miniphocaeibacter massiliensis]
MNFFGILLLGVGVSADAFAVAICKGLNLRKFSMKIATIVALFFGGFQALMTFLGWALGTQFSHLIKSVDHWIAFILLGIIGGKMLYEALQPTDSLCSIEEEELDFKELFMLSIATSIDALAVGISLAFIGVNIVISSAVIGITTFLFSFVAVYIGFKFGCKFQKKAEITGGIILILIGAKILLEHTGIIA